VNIRLATRPGDLGEVTALHGRLYAAEYGMDQSLEAYCGEGISRFALDRMEKGEEVGEMWVAEDDDGRVLGSVAMLAEEGMGRLRWLVLHPDLRGKGAGRKLVETSLDYARQRGFPGVFLTTISGLGAAHHIYRQAGFELTSSEPMSKWGIETEELRFDLKFGQTPMTPRPSAPR
jgi:N-acetylglutamate synthase-like GNAT family acetyltransferase